MIIRREWTKHKNHGLTVYHYKGWFLFGIIPVYIIRYTWKR